jgi:hypothetical protein
LFWELCANGSFLEVAEVLDYLKWLDFWGVYHYQQTLSRKYFTNNTKCMFTPERLWLRGRLNVDSWYVWGASNTRYVRQSNRSVLAVACDGFEPGECFRLLVGGTAADGKRQRGLLTRRGARRIVEGSGMGSNVNWVTNPYPWVPSLKF